MAKKKVGAAQPIEMQELQPKKRAVHHKRHHAQKPKGLTTEEKCGAIVIILAFLAALYFILIS